MCDFGGSCQDRKTDDNELLCFCWFRFMFCCVGIILSSSGLVLSGRACVSLAWPDTVFRTLCSLCFFSVLCVERACVCLCVCVVLYFFSRRSS